MIVAGHETTAVALFWSLFYLLAGSPEIQERLAAEVAGVDLGPDNAATALGGSWFTPAPSCRRRSGSTRRPSPWRGRRSNPTPPAAFRFPQIPWC